MMDLDRSSHRIRIFERFYRVIQAVLEQMVALTGLSIVKNLVLAMKGDIWVEEASGGSNCVSASTLEF